MGARTDKEEDAKTFDRSSTQDHRQMSFTLPVSFTALKRSCFKRAYGVPYRQVLLVAGAKWNKGAKANETAT
jgi:hypothetical protein